MNRILSIITLIIMIVSIIVSVSTPIKDKLASISENRNYASIVIPIPNKMKQENNFAKIAVSKMQASKEVVVEK